MIIYIMSFEEFWYELAVWSQMSFGDDLFRGPIGPLKHLAKEVQECLENPRDLEEYADLMHLVFDACRRAGFSFKDLRMACTTKLLKNQKRQWGKPSSDEAVEHIREGEVKNGSD